MDKILTGREVNVMQHALAYPHMARNIFHAQKGSLNDETWSNLYMEGLAILQNITDRHNVYAVTQRGIDALKEHLDDTTHI